MVVDNHRNPQPNPKGGGNQMVTAEVIDLGSTWKRCKSIPNFPANIYEAQI
jgi:hypothetical protein